MTEGRRSARREGGSPLVATEDRRREEHPETVPEAARPFPSRRQSRPEKINMIGRLAAWPRVSLARRAANSAEGAPRAYSPRGISIDARRTRVSRRHGERFIYTSGGRTQAPRPTTLLRLSVVPRFRRSRRPAVSGGGGGRADQDVGTRWRCGAPFSKNPRRWNWIREFTGM